MNRLYNGVPVFVLRPSPGSPGRWVIQFKSGKTTIVNDSELSR